MSTKLTATDRYEPNASEGGPTITHARLIRLAGLVSVAAAVLIIVSQLTGFFFGPDPANLSESVTTATATLYNILKLLGFFLLLLGLVGLYARQSVEAGVLGMIGFLVAFLGTMLVAGDWWFEAFAVPYLAGAAPQVLAEGASGTLVVGGLAGFVLFALGWVLFGVASFRARVFPRWTAIVLIVGGALGYQAGFPPFLLVLGLGVGLMGFSLCRLGGKSQVASEKPVTQGDLNTAALG
jgi:hypothetical protein